MTAYVCTPRASPAVFHPVGGEGNRLLIAGVVDLQAAVLRPHVGDHIPQHLLVLAEHLGGAADRDCMSWCCHGQAARSTGSERREFQRSSAARSVIL
jgi:hypothetical protein